MPNTLDLIRTYLPGITEEDIQDQTLRLLKAEDIPEEGVVYKFEGATERLIVEPDDESGEMVEKSRRIWMLRDRHGVLWTLNESTGLARVRDRIHPFDYVYLRLEQVRGGRYGRYYQWQIKVIPADRVPEPARW